MEFFPNAAPNHVENFKKLAREGFYNGTLFHRIGKVLLYKVEIQIHDKMVLEENNGALEVQDFRYGRI
jgi:cyclophilin family peptidyl-prolyl cis-trans isomerase